MADTIPPPAPEAAPARAPTRHIEDWAVAKGTAKIWLGAACAAQGWTDIRSAACDEAAYDAAILAVQTMRCG